jgi:phosphoribosyl-AMP cyclohydrolase
MSISFSLENVVATELPNFKTPDGLVTAVVQDATTGRVLMLAHMNREAWDETVATGRACYFSRSRGRLWRKGEESGHVQHVREAYVDCDGDAVLLKVDQTGAACHEGFESCFFRRRTDGDWEVIGEPLVNPQAVYKDKKN